MIRTDGVGMETREGGKPG